MREITVAVVGAGQRGFGYAGLLREHGWGRVVAVAEPNPVRREKFAREHGIAASNVVSDWRALASRARFADAVIISTMDAIHRDPAIAFLEKRYHMLLEKPMAPTPEDCRAIAAAAKKAGTIFAVCHVLRYTPMYSRIRRIIDEGGVGEVASITQLEPVAFYHQAHSFVRGNWRNSKESSFMLLAKCCHDVDVLQFLAGRRCEAVSSFGSLAHFRKDQKPKGAGARCVDCSIERGCAYSALRIYREEAAGEWPASILTEERTPAALREAIRTGPYGRCVYECDNDVVDHQVVNFLYEGGATAQLTMTAFTMQGGRETRVMGTQGEIIATEEKIVHNDFRRLVSNIYRADDGAEGGHGGGDNGIMKAWTAAVAAEDPALIKSGPDVSLETHLTVFAAEEARLKGTVERVADYL